MEGLKGGGNEKIVFLMFGFNLSFFSFQIQRKY